MLIVISSFIFFITAIALIILSMYQPGSRYAWLVAVGGGLLALVSIFIWQVQMTPFSLALWKPLELFTNPISFRPSGLSWPYAISLAALTLAVLLTAVARPNFTNS